MELEVGHVSLDWEVVEARRLGRARVTVVVVVAVVGARPLALVGCGDAVADVATIVKEGETEVVIWDCWAGQTETVVVLVTSLLFCKPMKGVKGLVSES